MHIHVNNEIIVVLLANNQAHIMYKILLLLAGGGIGTVARYVVSDYTHKYYLGSFPLGTLAVNMIGSLVIGGAGYGIMISKVVDEFQNMEGGDGGVSIDIPDADPFAP